MQIVQNLLCVKIFSKIMVFLFFIFYFLFILNCSLAQSEDFSISPHIIDEKARAKDILEYDIKIKNNTERKIEFYVILNDVTDEDGTKDYDYDGLDKKESLAKWIEIKRAQLEMGPNEEISVPLRIGVNLAAKPGKYYATIVFAPGSNKAAALKAAKESNYPKLMINIEVQDEVVEKAQINSFNTVKKIFLKPQILFDVNLKNIGNVELVPKGFIYVYNKRGEEVGTIDFNKEEKIIKPEEENLFAVNWDSSKLSGNFKAKLSLEYGTKEKKDLQDIIYFMILPWQKLVLLASLLMALVLILTIIIFKKTYKHHQPDSFHEFKSEHPDGVLDLKNRG